MLPTIARFALPQDFRRIDTASARIVLIEGGPRLLPAFPEDLSARAERDLIELGVEVRTNARVTNIGDGFVEMGTERIDARTIFWAAGNAASSLGASLGATRDRSGRVEVNDDLSIAGHPEVFVVGDLAVLQSDGKPVPGVAPAAMQSGRTAARNILHTVRGEGRERFRYFNKGDLATIGRYRAVGVLGGQTLERCASLVDLVVRAHHVSRRISKSAQRPALSGDIRSSRISVARVSSPRIRATGDADRRCRRVGEA